MCYDPETVKRYLICAALNETEMVCDYVESYGVYPDATWDGKPTALGYAALHGNDALVAFLLSHGADANHRDALDMTPLHYAALGGSLAAGRLLVDAGAQGHRRNRFGKTPAALVPASVRGPRRRVLVALFESGTRPLALAH